jgi:hypothetical protein
MFKDKFMAEVLEKQELPVIITKVKIGKKDLSQKLIEQLPMALYVYHLGEKHMKEKPCYGLPLVISQDGYVEELLFDETRPYKVDGTIIGFIKTPKINADGAYQSFTFNANELHKKKEVFVKNGYMDDIYYNFSGTYYFIIWYDTNNKLKKGYIDQWTASQLSIDIENMQIII